MSYQSTMMFQFKSRPQIFRPPLVHQRLALCSEDEQLSSYTGQHRDTQRDHDDLGIMSRK